MTEGLTSISFISHSKFMARLSDWMGAMAGLVPLDPPLLLQSVLVTKDVICIMLLQ